MKLEGKVALITGGGTGIGEATGRRFVAEGAKICIVGRRAEQLQRVAESLPQGTVLTCPGSVTEPEDIERMVTKTLTIAGKIDILVNSAGVSERGSVTESDPAEWRKTIETNLVGPYLLMRAVIPHLIKNGGGSVINISSLGGMRSIPHTSAYSASKAGLIMLTQQAALDYGPDRIRCNVVCPGLVKTPMIEGPFTSMAETIGSDLQSIYGAASKGVPLRRLAEPDDIAGSCSYLASDDSSYVTGVTLIVDGGVAVCDTLATSLDNFLGNKLMGD